jgi:hypothetical protein
MWWCISIVPIILISPLTIALLLNLMMVFDEGLVPNISRGRGRLIGGDLDVGEEGSEQMIVTLQSLHQDSVGY